MRGKARLYLILTAAILAGLACLPATALAQRRGPVHGGAVYRPAPVHSRVYVGVGWGYPYWGWGPAWGWGWGASWGWGGPWYGYPWGYPYPYPPDNSAEVKLEVKPKDAQVYVDGEFVGIVDDFDGMFQKMHVAPGDRELILFKPGFRTVKQTVRLRPRQDVKIRYALEPLAAGETAEPPPPPPRREEPPQRAAPPATPSPQAGEPAPSSVGIEARAFGALVFRVQPDGAEILIDGERWQGPAGEDRLVVQVAQGSHRIEIRKDGFVTFATDVSVRGGDTTPLNVSLPPRRE